MGGIGELIGTIARFVPLWVLVPLLLVLAGLAVPGWLEGVRIKRVKGVIRRVTRAEPAARQALLDEAWELAVGRPEVLLALAKEADKMNLPALRDQAVADLEARGTHAAALKQLAAPKSPAEEKRRFGHPVEAAVSIGRLIDIGATEAARERLAEALARFPRDEDLLALQESLEQRAPAG